MTSRGNVPGVKQGHRQGGRPVNPWGPQQNVRKPDRHADALWAKGAYVLREDDQYQWAVCVFEWMYLPKGPAHLNSIGAWCPNPAHALGWAKRNCSLGFNQFVLVKRAPFWTKIHCVGWRAPNG